MPLLEFGKKNNSNGLICIFHGYGAKADNLYDLGEALAKKMPEKSVIIPNALQKWEENPSLEAYQWFSLRDYNQEAMARQLEISSQTIIKWLVKRQEERCPDKPLYLIGFSQGAMVALYLAAAGLLVPNKIIAYSGLFIPPRNPKDLAIKNSKILAYHGSDDRVLPLDMSEKSYQLLNNYGLKKFQFIKEEGLGHTISSEGLKKGLEFIAHQEAS